MRINIQVSIEPDRPDTSGFVDDFTIRANPLTPMATILDIVKRNTPDMVRKGVVEVRAEDAKQAAKVAGR